MNAAWIVNGRESAVEPADRGLAYGDGLFETMARREGRILWFDYHWQRLQTSCERLDIACPDQSVVSAEIAALDPSSEDCVVKIIVTRGSSGRGYRPAQGASPSRIISVSPWPNYPESRYLHGIRVCHCGTRLGENSALAGMKHLCRLEQVLAQREVEAAGVDEGLMRSSSGYVMSGTMSNLFLVKSNQLQTPSLHLCGVAGVMRRAVIETAVSAGISVRKRLLSVREIAEADELFLSNSVFGIWPVNAVGDKQYSIGPITRMLMDKLRIPQNTRVLTA
jgi:4-amino-4-deoxychorismate lyase